MLACRSLPQRNYQARRARATNLSSLIILETAFDEAWITLRRCKPLFRGASRMSAGRQLCFHQSGLRKVTWHLPLELGEITRDRRHVEASEDRFLWLSVEQELEGGLETMLWRMLARRQAFARLSRHGDVVTRLALSFADDHLEHGRAVFGDASDFDHVDLLRGARTSPNL